MSARTTPAPRWWHVFTGDVPGVRWVMIIAEDSPDPPEIVQARCPIEAFGGLLWLAASFDHDPTDAEKDALRSRDAT